MLTNLKINNFAIIEFLTVGFKPGLNVLTGETGAGKSIIIDALNLILGGRADTDAIRTGQTSATVEAQFDLIQPNILETLGELGIETEDGQIVIKRIISSAGKSRCFINDSQITVGSLAKIGDLLIDIHGQHDHQALLHPETHIDILDLYGKIMPIRKQLEEKFADHQTDLRKLREMRTRNEDRQSREELLHFQLAEIGNAALEAGEDDELASKKNKLQHAEKIHQTIDQLQNILDDTEGSVIQQLGRAVRDMEPLVEIDPALENQVKRAQTAYYEVEELVEELRNYSRAIEFNPARLEEIDDRIADINGLKRKYGSDIPSILAKREKMLAELDSLATYQESMTALEESLKEQEKILTELATSLAEKREKTAIQFKKNVEKELRYLDMASVQFGARFDYEPDDSGFVNFRKQTLRLTSKGIGTMEFLFSPNPGEDLRPLAKIASGGELSRVMLALKSILNEQDTVPIMIFDEVDTGIGGKIAEKVGSRLKKVATGRQVFSITHLPQIAGMASAHYRVQKDVKGKRTHSTINELDYEDRVREIARMSGGEKVTEVTLKYAREMIKP